MTNPTAEAFAQGYDTATPETPDEHQARVRWRPNWDGRLFYERNRLTENPDGSLLCEFWNDYGEKSA